MTATASQHDDVHPIPEAVNAVATGHLSPAEPPDHSAHLPESPKGSMLYRWGPRLDESVEVRFAIWSPGGRVRALRLNDRLVELSAAGDGWWECTPPDARPGTLYRFVLDDGTEIADPASRAQVGGVSGPSMVVDPAAYRWNDAAWRGRAWEETVYYELHVGTFTSGGTFRAAAEKLEHLAALGITVIELMPVAQFAGARGWGYDGVLPYAPHDAYGAPDDMKAFVDRAHQLGIGVVLDVVYNHFGPVGNYLPVLAPEFFHPEHATPWGAAIAYEKQAVRHFFIDNALYWLDEFHLDGLRLDAIDHIADDESDIHIVVELAKAVRARTWNRPIFLTTEDSRNITSLHERGPNGETSLYDAEWNDDFHNVAHHLATGESQAYYADFTERGHWRLARCLAEGFAFQGEIPTSWDGARGEPSAHLPPTAFVNFIQNHDQVGNRAFGERLLLLADERRVETLLAMLLLAPAIPLLFMGEEWGETRPFAYFTDFDDDLARTVRKDRHREFSTFRSVRHPQSETDEIPDPNSPATFELSKIDWQALGTDGGRHWYQLTTRLLSIRRRHIVPLLGSTAPFAGSIDAADDNGHVAVSWRLGSCRLSMTANLGDKEVPARAVAGAVVYASPAGAPSCLSERGRLPAFGIVVAIEGAGDGVAP